jgi:NADPH2:quinone reductase
MRAVFCEKYGSHKDLVVREIDEPGPPAAGEIKVALRTREIQFSDLVRFRGEYQVSSELPFVAGGDGAGEVISVGPDVDDVAIGDLVLSPGGCVERVNVRASAVTQIPPGTDLEAAASFRGAYSTAYLGMQRGRLQPGEVLLVHGAAGGMGLAAVDIGKLFGATVIGTASSDEKLKVVSEMGADHIINYSNGFRDEVKALTGGRGADVIYDPVGGDTFDESMRCIAPYGRILIVGFTGGRPALAKTNHLLVKDAEVIGYTIGGFAKHRPALARQNHKTLLDWLANGRIHPYISHRLPMEQAVDAYQLIVDRKVIGKVMLS